LVTAAVACGLEGARVRELLSGDEDVALIEAEARSAKDAGIDGVPFFILGGLIGVGGAQAPEYLAQLMERAAGELAQRDAAE
jgi:predicted DsbA family dithiol-disulfide isomerase